MELDTNNHSVFMLNYHLIMCVKYRNNVIDDAISLRLKEIFKNICLNYNISLEEWNHDKDHRLIELYSILLVFDVNRRYKNVLLILPSKPIYQCEIQKEI